MKKITVLMSMAGVASLLFFTQCSQKPAEGSESEATEAEKKNEFGGFATREAWGEHLVTIGACNDCHTPKKMTDHGPVLDSSLLLSGHPSSMPAPPVDRKEVESKGLAVTQTLTSWVGPWGVSYAANLTSDETGIGNWQESNFFTAIREGKYKGISSSRPLLPPMPWDMYRNMTDDELRAVFAFLKSTKPVKNIVPQPDAPLMASH